MLAYRCQVKRNQQTLKLDNVIIPVPQLADEQLFKLRVVVFVNIERCFTEQVGGHVKHRYVDIDIVSTVIYFGEKGIIILCIFVVIFPGIEGHERNFVAKAHQTAHSIADYYGVTAILRKRNTMG